MKKIPPQITHLVLLTVVLILIYLLSVFLMTPASFGRYGFYRGDALAERANLPRRFGGELSCTECHKEASEKIKNSSHSTLGCESCHTASNEHVLQSKVESLYPPKLDNSEFCLRCHLKTAGRPKKFKQITEPKHSEGESCFECHDPHNPEEEPE